MRDYSKVSGQFWIGKTGRDLRGHPEAQIVALYLMTSPHSNMIGVYHCPLAYIAHETGLTIEGASKGLARLIEGQFCSYFEDSEIVFVHEMAKFQISDQLKAEDKQVIGIRKAVENIPESRARTAFQEKYADAFHLIDSPKKPKGLARGSQAPPKPGTGTGDRTGDIFAPSDDSLDAAKVAERLPLNDGAEFPVLESQCAEWGRLFPSVDVTQELRGMRAWLLANPERRKTSKGVMRFATSWLSKEQDRGRPINGTQHASQQRDAEGRLKVAI